jgi:hypothetical protein
MSNTSTFNILQYNVRNDRVTTMIPLLADSRIKDFDIIAIQEPWRNPSGPTTLSSSQSGFHLLYRPGGDTRVCFYVNEKINPNSWEVNYPSADMISLTMQVLIENRSEMIHIHNIYNPSPLSYSSTESPSVLPEVRRHLTGCEGHQILLGDFNLHHPLWNGPTRLTQHAAADQWLDLAEDLDLSLTLPAGTITWEARNVQSTIDLTFMTGPLADRVIHCNTRPDLNQSSDHIPILTSLTLNSEANIIPPRRAWKSMNWERIRQEELHAPPPVLPRSVAEIDQQVTAIQLFLGRVIDAAVPWARPSEYAKPFWDDECSAITKEARRKRRIWSNDRARASWEEYAKINDKKHKIIQRAKTRHFRQAIGEATGTPKGLWRLAKWARSKSQAPRELPKMPPLHLNDRTATTFAEKAEMLREVFFPAPPPADLTDIEGSFYPTPTSCPLIITEREVEEALRRPAPDKAPGPDGIPFRILRACSKTLTTILTPLFQSCIELSYHPNAFKMANTITIKKPGKGDYTVPKAYRPIALLNTLGKSLESIIGRKISYLAEAHRLLPDTQMGARRGRSTETALELLTEQVHTVWGQGNDKVATLLSMDVAGAFDTVAHRRLTHNLRKRRIPQWIVNWIDSFLVDRRTTLAIHRTSTDQFPVQTGIPQGSPLSPILYLFYNADLLEITNRPGTAASGLGFVDDVNILAYGKSTEDNCKSLEIIHRACERWAVRHGAVFAPAKYELIHLTRSPKRFNMTATINIDSTTITPKTDIRVLGLQIDTKLRWGPHVRKIQGKMIGQSMALSKISTSTWGATFARARQVYTAVVRPAITYGSAVWHTPKEVKNVKSSTNKLTIMQNKCLRTIAGAFRATPIPVLEAETFISPMDAHLDQLQASARVRLRSGGHQTLIANACRAIAKKLRGKAGRRRDQKPTPGDEKHSWTKQILQNRTPPKQPAPFPPWDGPRPEEHTENEAYNAAMRACQSLIKAKHTRAWSDSWAAYLRGVTRPSVAQTGIIGRQRLKMHQSLRKAESSLITQIRSEKIGLASFLFHRRVPGVLSPACSCGWHQQTAKHVIMFCRQFDRETLKRELNTNDYRVITSTPRTLRILVAWFMQLNLLSQFSLARDILYE